ncbi:nuclease [Micromonospora globispora]|uniref:Nuclease n=1 Tax=Micromonospora globispora TaxID=1450148 RepID=A0A317K5Z0_9ACTN|nr:lamin tail domain-containing protein [Micromonospora globispora]PWU47282.1 nuclease [Micromonospora globispora]PWU58613.1 nuclease [Micromonospora globispora]
MRRNVLAGLAVGVLAATLCAAPAAAASPDVVISEIYGGGGNAGATYRNDFVELYNRSSASVSLTGWSVQYASASGSTWSVTSLSGSIAPGGSYLVKLASGGSTGAALPTADATGTTNMSATSGKVALRTTTTALTCSTSCAFVSGNRDFVGYGSANDAEGTRAPGGSNTASVARTNPAVDSDNNAADFAAGSPTPSNTSGTGSCPTGTRIRDIQGAGHLAALTGTRTTRGIVTAKSTAGFWLQDPCPDGSDATSEGLYVSTSGSPTVSVGDDVSVTGSVSEVRPGGAATNLTVTTMAYSSKSTLGTGKPLPAATVVGSGGRVPPGAVIEDDATGNVETSGTFDPASDGLDFWESLEGMRVQIASAAVVGPTNSYGEFPVVPGGSGVRSTRGGIVTQSGDFNPERVMVGDTLATAPTVTVGDTFGAALTGVLSYDFGDYFLLPSSFPSRVSGGLTAETTTAAGSGQLAVATFNVQNLDPTDPQSKFDALAGQIVTNLRSPDLVALEEVQDNNGATDNGVVACDQTMSKLISAISAKGGPSYAYRQINPTNDADGGEPGGNIRQVFLFRTDRGLSFTDRPGGTATAATTVTNAGGVPQLSYSPGRVQPADSAFNTSRKPLAGEFRWNNRPLFVIANHFNSKGGDDPLMGRYQPPSAPSETQRHQQATIVNSFVDSIRAVDPNAAIVVLGDINDYDFSRTADLLVGSGELVDLPRTLPVAERYTYVYEGNSQVLDHILLSSWLAAQPYVYDVVHVNSEFPTQVSDHEPQVVRLTF